MNIIYVQYSISKLFNICYNRSMQHRLLDLSKLKFEPRKVMRYDDMGDYFGDTIITYDTGDPVVNNAILIHEFIEYTLIKSAGLTPEMIDKFDTDETYPEKFPNEYELYDKFHDMANLIERQFIENLGLKWKEHEKKINTTKVQVAVQKVTDELHKPHPSEKRMEQSTKQVTKAFKEETES